VALLKNLANTATFSVDENYHCLSRSAKVFAKMPSLSPNKVGVLDVDFPFVFEFISLRIHV